MGLLSIIVNMFGPSQEWEPCPLHPLTMRRKIKGQLQYRPATEEEEAAAAERQAFWS